MLISDNLLKVNFNDELCFQGFIYNSKVNMIILKATILIDDKIQVFYNTFPTGILSSFFQSWSIPLSEGFLISASVELMEDPQSTSSCHGVLSLCRNINGANARSVELTTGFFEFALPLIWNISCNSSNPDLEIAQFYLLDALPGIVPYIFSGFPTEKFRVLYVQFLLTTSITPGNRQVQLRRFDSTIVGNLHLCSTIQAASLAYTYCIHDSNNVEVLIGTTVFSPWKDHFINGNFNFYIDILNTKAGDTITNVNLILERIF